MKRKDLLGGARLALDAVKGVTGLVEAVHMNVLDRAIGTPAIKPVRAVTQMVYRTIGAVTALTGKGLDQVLERATPILSDVDWKGRTPVLAALNGVLGDHLEATGNPLAIRMSLSPEAATGRRIVLMIHGLCMSGAQWLHEGVDQGAMLARERGYVPLYLDYNSGRAIAENGRDLARVLGELDARPEVEEIVVVAHSMGGLILRSALASITPSSKLSRVVFLGTPHSGAPLERLGNWITAIADLNAYSAPFTRLAKLRSAGIMDLRHGLPAALPTGVLFYAVAGVMGEAGASATDGLVPLDSAIPSRLQFAATATLARTGHMALLSSSEVTQQLLRWL